MQGWVLPCCTRDAQQSISGTGSGWAWAVRLPTQHCWSVFTPHPPRKSPGTAGHTPSRTRRRARRGTHTQQRGTGRQARRCRWQRATCSFQEQQRLQKTTLQVNERPGGTGRLLCLEHAAETPGFEADAAGNGERNEQSPAFGRCTAASVGTPRTPPARAVGDQVARPISLFPFGSPLCECGKLHYF